MSNDTSNDSSIINLPGGVIRVQAPAPVDPNPVPSDILREGVGDGGAFRMTPEGNVEAFGAVAKYAVRDERGNASSILDTARGPGGSRHKAITDAHSIVVGGHEISVGAAVNLGILRRLPGGGYEATGKGLE